MLVSARGRANGPAFLLGWIVGVASAGALLLLIASGADASNEGQPADWVSWLKLALGIASCSSPPVSGVAARPGTRSPRRRGGWAPSPISRHPKPAERASSSRRSTPRTYFSSSREWPRSLRRVSLRDSRGVALLVFTIIASVSVATPVLVYFTVGERSAEPLGRLKTWMTQNNAVIMAVLSL
jgi:hypothetical protein